MKRFSANQGKILINTSDNEIYVSDGRAGAVWRALPWAAFVGSRVGSVIEHAVDDGGGDDPRQAKAGNVAVLGERRRDGAGREGRQQQWRQRRMGERTFDAQ